MAMAAVKAHQRRVAAAGTVEVVAEGSAEVEVAELLEKVAKDLAAGEAVTEYECRSRDSPWRTDRAQTEHPARRHRTCHHCYAGMC